MSYHAWRTPATLTTQPEIGQNVPALASHCNWVYLPTSKGLLVCSHQPSFLWAICMLIPFQMASSFWCYVPVVLSFLWQIFPPLAFGSTGALMVWRASCLFTYYCLWCLVSVHAISVNFPLCSQCLFSNHEDGPVCHVKCTITTPVLIFLIQHNYKSYKKIHLSPLLFLSSPLLSSPLLSSPLLSSPLLSSPLSGATVCVRQRGAVMLVGGALRVVIGGHAVSRTLIAPRWRIMSSVCDALCVTCWPDYLSSIHAWKPYSCLPVTE